MSSPFTIRILSWPDARALARPVREAVFIVEQRVPRELEWDEWDARSDHALAVNTAGEAIGTARLLPDGRIGRMAVLAAHRGAGAGTALLRELLGLARQRGMTRITLHAQTHAAGFYGRFGFSAAGETFLEAGIPHVEMVLDLCASGRGA
jgi:predicted GNAT family N-acyltransferase